MYANILSQLIFDSYLIHVNTLKSECYSASLAGNFLKKGYTFSQSRRSQVCGWPIAFEPVTRQCMVGSTKEDTWCGLHFISSID